jgi:signal transduction histidine kinase
MENDELLKPLLDELWAARDRDAPAGETPLASVDSLAQRLVEAGRPPSAAVRIVLAAGRLLVEHAEHDRAVDGAQTRRLQRLVDEAAVQLAAAVERARRARRQAWLSFLVHELKNPLNTVLNALWLIKQKAGGDQKQTERFLELAERAVKRLENRTRDVRELDEELVKSPPGWEESARAVASQV